MTNGHDAATTGACAPASSRRPTSLHRTVTAEGDTSKVTRVARKFDARAAVTVGRDLRHDPTVEVVVERDRAFTVRVVNGLDRRVLVQGTIRDDGTVAVWHGYAEEGASS